MEPSGGWRTRQQLLAASGEWQRPFRQMAPRLATQRLEGTLVLEDRTARDVGDPGESEPRPHHERVKRPVLSDTSKHAGLQREGAKCPGVEISAATHHDARLPLWHARAPPRFLHQGIILGSAGSREERSLELVRHPHEVPPPTATANATGVRPVIDGAVPVSDPVDDDEPVHRRPEGSGNPATPSQRVQAPTPRPLLMPRPSRDGR